MGRLTGVIVGVVALAWASESAIAASSPTRGASPALGMPIETLVYLTAAGLVLAILVIADVIRPGSLDRGGLRGVAPHPWYIWLAAALLPFGAALIGGMGVQAAVGSVAGSVRDEALTAAGSYTFGLAAAVFMVRMLASGAPGAGLSVSAKGLLWGVLAFVLTWPIVASAAAGAVWVYESVTHESPSSVAHGTLDLLLGNRADPWAWVLAGLAVVAAPVMEEILYRGFLQSALLRMTGTAWGSVLLTSTIFALMHRGGSTPVPWHAVAVIFVLGLACGVAFEKSRKLGIPIVMHVLFNLANVVMALMTRT